MTQLWRRLRARFARQRLDDELRLEIATHIASRTQALIADGMDPQDAAREARRQFGNVAAIAERTREVRGFPALESIVQDLRYGARLLWRAPLFTTVAVLSIAFGLTAATGIFAVTNAFVLRPIAGTDHEIHAVYTGNRSGSPFGSNSYADFRDFSAAGIFAAACAIAPARANVTADAQSRLRSGALFTDGCFDLLSVRPHLGRMLGTGPSPEVVISYALWNRQFRADPSAVGAYVAINGAPAVVVGVAEPGFNGTSLDRNSDFWVRMDQFGPLFRPGALHDRQHRGLTVFVRLRDGATASQAAAVLGGVAAGLHRDDPAAWTTDAGGVRRVTVMKETEARFASAPGALPALLLGISGAIGAIILIASVNIATMLLARGASRTRELTIRLAIGASRERLLRQLATECLLIALLGTALALGAITAGFRVFDAHRPDGIPAVHLAIDWRVALFSAVVAALATVLCGLLPATHVVRLAIAEGIKGRGAALRTRWLRAGMREALIVVQVTASIAMLLVSALFARGLAAGAAASPGFAIDGIVTIGIEVSGIRETAPASVAARMLAAVAAVPGVDSPAIAGVIPLIGSSRTVEVRHGDGDARAVAGDVVSPGYLRTMGMRLLRGRDLTEADRQGMPNVALVSETFSRTYFKTTEAVGQTVTVAGNPVEIVGVFADIRYRSVSEPYLPLIYLPFAQRPQQRFLIHARIRGGGDTLAAVDAAARSIDPRILIDGAVPLSRRLEEIRMPERVSGWIGAAAGLVQFALVLMALWGLVAYSVARRTREIGVRVALGATPGGLVGMLMRPALLLIGVGAILGTAIGIAGAIVMQSQFDGLAPVEPRAALPAILVMATVAALAALVPALRATRVNPIQTLRAE